MGERTLGSGRLVATREAGVEVVPEGDEELLLGGDGAVDGVEDAGLQPDGHQVLRVRISTHYAAQSEPCLSWFERV